MYGWPLATLQYKIALIVVERRCPMKDESSEHVPATRVRRGVEGGTPREPTPPREATTLTIQNIHDYRVKPQYTLRTIQ